MFTNLTSFASDPDLLDTNEEHPKAHPPGLPHDAPASLEILPSAFLQPPYIEFTQLRDGV